MPVRRLANEADQAFGRAMLSYTVSRRWRRGASGGPAILVGGFHSAVLGVGQGARLFAQALETGGYDVSLLEMAHLSPAALQAVDDATSKSCGVLVTHVNPPELELYLQRTKARSLKGRRHIGYWAWELPIAPPVWARAFAYVDEVWCPSAFTAAALRAMAPPEVPVRVVPHPMFVLPSIQPDRARFGLAADACIVLQAFDLRSTAARKNPFGGLDAYLRAVPQAGPAACLVCKVVGAEAFPAIFDQLKARVAQRSDLVLIAGELSSSDMLALTASADIVLSLHRAEGFGLLLAEAMWMGLPVVATGWSGNMDFMDADSAALIDFTLVAARDPQGMYAQGGLTGALWAEPDIDQAAETLRTLIGDPGARQALGRRGQAKARRLFNRDAWLARTAALLAGVTPDLDVGPEHHGQDRL